MIWLPLTLVALTVLLVTFGATVALLQFARRYRIYPSIRARDVHTTPTPRLGGIAMYLGLLAGLGVASLLPSLHTVLYSTGSEPVIAIIAAATVIVILGVLDDMFDLRWYVKLSGELVAAVLLTFVGGLRINQAPIGDLATLVVSQKTSIVITILAIMVTINMMNFIDGLDGLVAGIAIIANVAYLTYCVAILPSTGQAPAVLTPIILTAIMGAVCLGFLPLNWHPAKIFMGDTGSLLIGLMLASTAIILIQNVDPTQVFATNYPGQYTRAAFAPAFLLILLPIVVLIIPLVDFILAISRRILAGKSPFTADRKHLHHRLLDMGHSPLHATLIFYSITLVISVGSLLFLFATPMIAWAVIGGGLCACAVVTLLPLTKRKQVEVKVQTTPITVITPEMLTMDPLEGKRHG